MKKIGHFINFQKRNTAKKAIDEKTIFFLFNKVVGEMYGKKGSENLRPERYSKAVLFFSSKQPLWAADVLVNQKELLDKINQQIGSIELKEIKNQR
jgi:predicted nucleic acid-binding Zn ribbon protein